MLVGSIGAKIGGGRDRRTETAIAAVSEDV